MNPRVVVVLGMHRSGTSALARMLMLLGADPPRHLIEGFSDNPRGHWEPAKVVDLNNEMLEAAGFSWHHVEPFPESWYETAQAEQFRRRAVELISDEFAGSSLFAFKDPRVCRTLPFWRSVFRELGVEPAYVLITRNPLEIAASLRRRDQIPQPAGILLWLRYVLDAERHTRGQKRVLVSYGDLLRDWRGVAETISEGLGIPWPRSGHDAAAEMERFLSDDERHHTFTLNELNLRPDVAGWVKRTYEVMESAVSAREEPDARALGRILADLNEADRAYGPLLAEARLESRDLRERLDTTADELSHLRSEEGHRKIEIEEMREEHERDRRKHDLEQDRKDQELTEIQARANSLSVELENTLADRERLQNQLAADRKRLDEALKQDQELSTALEESNTAHELELERVRAELDRVRKDLEAERDREASLKREREARVAELENARREQERLGREKQAVQEELAHAQNRLAWATRTRSQRVADRLRGLRRAVAVGLRRPAQLRPRHLRTYLALRRCGEFDPAFYRARYADLAPGTDPLLHYIVHGATERRDPNPGFDTTAYLARHPEIDPALVNPLLHSVRSKRPGGTWARSVSQLVSWVLRRPSTQRLKHVRTYFALRREGVFDGAFYRSRYPDVPPKMNALMHYIEHGVAEGRNPNPDFDTAAYLGDHPELAESGINPLLHFVRSKGRESAETAAFASRSEKDEPEPAAHRNELKDESWGVLEETRMRVKPGEAFEEFDPTLAAGRERRAKLIAFHLPQFHAIPENDRWWGKGFTEWRNVMRGMPRFAGHYQPRIPRDLGCYDLSDPEILKRQATLAADAGLYGFAFYYYSFGGRRLLERPIEQLLEHASIDFPFCLVWANENWSRRWDGEHKEVLIAQDHAARHDEALIDDLQRHFRDPRYIRLAGRPLFIVYRFDLFPEPHETIARWRRLWRERHSEEPLIFVVQAFGENDPRDYGADGAIEFPPQTFGRRYDRIRESLDLFDSSFSAEVLSYEQVAADALAMQAPEFSWIRGVTPSWDNDARRQGSGTIIHGSTPSLYEQWLSGAIEHARAHPVGGEPIVFVNAWNEWAEGAYLEPDVHFGAAYLNATARAVCAQSSQVGESGGASIPTTGNLGVRSTNNLSKVLLVGHDAHAAGAQMILLHYGKVLKNQFGFEVTFLLVEGGEMLPDYRLIGETHVIQDLVLAEELVENLRERGYAAAVTNSAGTGIVVSILKRSGYTVVSLIHEMRSVIEFNGLEPALKQIADHSDHIVVAAEPVRRDVCEVAPEAAGKIVIRPQGLYRELTEASAQDGYMVKRELGIEGSDQVVIMVGVLGKIGDQRKGLDRFVEAARQAEEQAPDLNFIWVGDVPREVKDSALSGLPAPVADRVYFAGRVGDVAPYYAAADVFFLSSREDPFPSVVLEAMALGLPVVGFHGSGGADELIAAHGTLVDPGDPQELTRALQAASRETDQSARQARKRAIRDRFRYDDYCFDIQRLASPRLQRISVIVPNYNYSRYLEERLSSIFDQSYPVFEIVVLDDGSTDDSLDALKRLTETSGRRFAVIPSDRNSGSVYRQWARACEVARGDCVWIAEADDLARDGFLDALTTKLRGGGVGFAFCDSTQIDDHGRPLGDDYKPYYREVVDSLMDQDFVLDGEEFVRMCLTERNLVLNVSAVLWSRPVLARAIDRCTVLLDTYRLTGDWLLYAAAALSGVRVGYVAEPLNVHRRHGAGVTASLASDRHLDEVRRVHVELSRWLKLDARERARMDAYVQSLTVQFGA